MKRRKTYNKYHDDTNTKRTENHNSSKQEKSLLRAMLFPQLTNLMTGGGYNTTTKNKEEF